MFLFGGLQIGEDPPPRLVQPNQIAIDEGEAAQPQQNREQDQGVAEGR